MALCACAGSGASGTDLDLDDDDGGAADAALIASLRAASPATGPAGGAAAAVHFDPPHPGAPGIGDTLLPTLGNGGYRTLHYDLRLTYDLSGALPAVDGTVRILAIATESLSQFDLDFAGTSIGSVRVDGLPAAFHRDGEELVIKPPFPLLRGLPFLVTVTHFTATAVAAAPRVFPPPAFIATPDGSAWVMQPDTAHDVFPSNDHPSDKASFSFRIDVPEGMTAVANGVQTGVETHNGRSVFRFEQLEPMATELAQVAVGALTVISRGVHGGVAVRDVVPTSQLADLEPKLAAVTGQLDFMQNLVGDYPFSTYGSLVLGQPGTLGVALECQTLSIYDSGFFTSPPTSFGPVMVHELAHQWFGDSVAPAQWSDVWQNEGHATWYELSARFGLDSPAFTARFQQLYLLGDLFRQFLGPVASPLGGDAATLFSGQAYNGGALVLFALRQQVGDAVFQNIERAWVTKYRGKAAGTQDFIALASEVSGQDLTAYLTAWFYGTTTPTPMPGHPDWTVQPAGLAAPQSLAGGAAQLPEIAGLDPLEHMKH